LPLNRRVQGPALATPHPIFHAPGHDHARCEADVLADAERACATRGARLTPLRRRALAALVSEHRPLGAYEIMERMASDGTRPAPITVYRALDFLLENGLVHRIASRNAFVACAHKHTATDSVVFLICERCGTVGESSSAAIKNALHAAAVEAGFVPHLPMIEVAGICVHCRARDKSDA
jgi:Fur family zinc uptake transcriptional regulator